MKSVLQRIMAAAVLAICAWAVLIGAAAAPKTAAKSTAIKEPDKLIILSTTDVKGKTSPCG